jgi:beta-lactamase class A
MRNVVASLTLIWLASACSSSPGHAPADAGGDVGLADGDGGGDAATDAGADGNASPVGDAADGGVTPPDTAVGHALAWMLAALNGSMPTVTDVKARFAPAFLQAVPPDDLLAVLNQLAESKPWTLQRFEGLSTARTLVAVLTQRDGQFIRLFLGTDALGHITSALFQPAGDLDPALDSWDEIDHALSALAPGANLLAATLDADGCTPTHALGPDVSLAIGSAFKLWILSALATDVASGKHAWTDKLAIADAHKSLPSGDLQTEAAGTELPLRRYADKMISISDNTAADHLLFFLGRETVEAALTSTGHHDPTLNQPFLGTRELFNLKLMVTAAEQQAYLAATIAGRRTLLDQYDAAYDPRTYAGPDWTAPKLIAELEWFATPRDLCGVMRALEIAGAQAATAPVLDVLAINPGLPDATNAFAYIGFKGGSEPGVLNLTWLLRRAADDRWVFLTLGLNDPAKPLDEDRAAYVATAARALVGKP